MTFVNKKDLKLIIILLILALLGFGGYKIVQVLSNKQIGIVEVSGRIVLEFDISKDGLYEFDGAYGHMHLQVEDEKFRVYNVECPNHQCEQMGWVSAEDIFPIICMPNEVIVYAQE